MINYSNLAKFVAMTLLLTAVISWTMWWFKLGSWAWSAVVVFIAVVNGILGAEKWPLFTRSKK